MMTFTAEPDVATAPAPWDIKQLLCANAFPHPVRKIELRETHLSWVLLTGPFAYKIKKPVRLDFIDASTLSQRRHFCNEELRLNQRLTADLYVNVVTVSLHDGHARVGVPGVRVVDYAVCMHQFDGEDELAALLERDEVALSEITDLAGQIDLVSHEREDLATALLSKYLEITGDYDGVRVLPFYAVYRALVRAKVDAISIRQSSAHAEEFRQRLQRRVQTAVEWLDRPRPMLILMHGASGSGKSWLSERLVPNFPALRIRSDIERKRFARPIESRQSNDLYAPEVTHRTYARLLECAESVMQAGFSAIVDATFLDPIDRELFHGLARRLQCAYAIVSCHADTSTLTQRIEARTRKAADPSDADRRVLAMQLSSLLPFPKHERPNVIFADTRQPLVVRHVTSALQAKLSSLP